MYRLYFCQQDFEKVDSRCPQYVRDAYTEIEQLAAQGQEGKQDLMCLLLRKIQVITGSQGSSRLQRHSNSVPLSLMTRYVIHTLYNISNKIQLIRNSIVSHLYVSIIGQPSNGMGTELLHIPGNGELSIPCLLPSPSACLPRDCSLSLNAECTKQTPWSGTGCW